MEDLTIIAMHYIKYILGDIGIIKFTISLFVRIYLLKK